MKKIILILILLHLTASPSLFPQKRLGWEIEGRIIASSLDDFVTPTLAVNYNYWITPYVGYSIGGYIAYF
jgi:hypothetical protein